MLLETLYILLFFFSEKQKDEAVQKNNSIFSFKNLFLCCLSAVFFLNDQQSSQHQQNPCRKGNPRRFYETGNDIRYKGNCCCGQRIRQLGSHMIDMITLRSRRRHNGGIGLP